MAKTTKTRAQRKQEKAERPIGFLGFKTNTFDRYFISVVIAIALGLLYLRFLEPIGVPSIVPWAVVLTIGFFVVRKG